MSGSEGGAGALSRAHTSSSAGGLPHSGRALPSDDYTLMDLPVVGAAAGDVEGAAALAAASMSPSAAASAAARRGGGGGVGGGGPSVQTASARPAGRPLGEGREQDDEAADPVSVGTAAQRLRSSRSFSELRAAAAAGAGGVGGSAAAAARVAQGPGSDVGSLPSPGAAGPVFAPSRSAPTVKFDPSVMAGASSGGGSGGGGGSGAPSPFRDASGAAAAAGPGGVSAAGPGEQPIPGGGPSRESGDFASRQRTRARSGGGDLPPNLTAAAKRATAKQQQQQAGAAAAGGNASGASAATSQQQQQQQQDNQPTGPGVAVGPTAQYLPGAYKRRGAAAAGAAGDLEAGRGSGGAAKAAKTPYRSSDPHKSRLRAFAETATEGCKRMLDDPWLFVWHLHLVLTLIHFVLWVSTYGGVGGPGPASPAVRAFDDIVLAMMGLSGWLAVVYFFRGCQATGVVAVVLEACFLDLLRFLALFVLWNIGFAIAMYTLHKGTLYTTNTPYDSPLVIGPDGQPVTPDRGNFANVGRAMMALIQLALGYTDFDAYCNVGYAAPEAFCTMLYLAYLATTATLLLTLLTAMIVRTWALAQGPAEGAWRRRWALYTLKAERRMPAAWRRAHRLGQPAWDPRTGRYAYSHVFEQVDGDGDEVVGGGGGGGSGGGGGGGGGIDCGGSDDGKRGGGAGGGGGGGAAGSGGGGVGSGGGGGASVVSPLSSSAGGLAAAGGSQDGAVRAGPSVGSIVMVDRDDLARLAEGLLAAVRAQDEAGGGGGVAGPTAAAAAGDGGSVGSGIGARRFVA
jgi:hypothetical protein